MTGKDEQDVDMFAACFFSSMFLLFSSSILSWTFSSCSFYFSYLFIYWCGGFFCTFFIPAVCWTENGRWYDRRGIGTFKRSGARGPFLRLKNQCVWGMQDCWGQYRGQRVLGIARCLHCHTGTLFSRPPAAATISRSSTPREILEMCCNNLAVTLASLQQMLAANLNSLFMCLPFACRFHL